MKGIVSKSEFRELYFKYHPVAFRVAMYISKNPEEAEDVVQEVFLKLWESRENIPEIQNPEAYLVRVTRNLAIDKLRDSKKERETILELTLNDPDSVESPEMEQLRKVLEEMVSQLPPKCRLVFSLSRFEGLSNDEIAAYLDISKRTVETQISLALKAFRGELKPGLDRKLTLLPTGTAALLMLFF